MDQASAESGNSGGLFGWLRRLDDAVFAVEKAIVIASLIGMTILVFLDVVYRRLVSPDSKIGSALSALAGIDDPATRQVIDHQVAPWVGALLGIGLLWFGFATAERHSGKRMLPIRHSALVLGFVGAVAIALLGWLMLHPQVPSNVFFMVLFGLVAVTWSVRLARQRPAGWKLNIGLLWVVIAPAFIYVAIEFMPMGFSWSKELSLILLLWIGFLGASICAHEGKHLRMEAFDRLLPAAAARWLHAAGFLATAGFCAIMGWLGYYYIFGPYGAYDLGGVFEQTKIPDWIATFSVPVGFGLATMRFTGAAVSAVLGGRYGLPAAEESLIEAQQRAAAAEKAGADALDEGPPPEPPPDPEADDASSEDGDAR
ncbi:MAG: TRAP transporter small permease [Myxococcota bacterium]